MSRRNVSVSAWGLIAAAIAASLAAPNSADAGIVVHTDRYSYSGTVTRYDNLQDALAGTNPGTTYAIPQRDVSLRFRDSSTGLADPGSSDSAFFFVPNWQGVPAFNQNHGFVQIADADGATIQSGDALFNPAGDAFGVLAIGGNAAKPQFARLGHDPSMNGLSAAVTQGVFHEYALDAVFTGLASFTSNSTNLQSGDIQTVEQAINGSGADVLGILHAVFENTNPIDPSYHGFYGIELALSNVSVSFSGFSLNASNTEGCFIVSGLTPGPNLAEAPEPSSLLLCGLAAIGAGVGFARRRRSRNA